MSSAAGPLGSKFSHLDLVVSDLDRSLAFYGGLLEPLGWTRLGEIVGEAGERVVYRSVPGSFTALGLREKRSDAHGVPFDRYAVGLHHLCFDVASREVVDERAAWLRDQGAEVESGRANTTTRRVTTPCSSSIPTGSSSSCCTVRWSSPRALASPQARREAASRPAARAVPR